MKKEEQTTYTMRISDLLALCNIIDDYENFNQNFREFISKKHSPDIMIKLSKISQGNHKVLRDYIKTKKFYFANKNTIDTINYHSDIISFLSKNYTPTGNPYVKDIDYFYQYLKEHKESLTQIIKLIEKIQYLGFEELEFNENFDFTKTEYKIYKKFFLNSKVEYLENIEIIPNYESSVVKYKTTKSNYKIIASTKSFDEFTTIGQKIQVNNLLFDSKKLPHSIIKNNIFDKIINKQNKIEEQTEYIQDSVNLNIAIDDFNKELDNLYNTVIKLNKYKNKSELLEILLTIQNYLVNIQTLSVLNDAEISKENPNINKTLLHKEKKLYLERRNWRSIDLD